jgi:magnesium transporter
MPCGPGRTFVSCTDYCEDQFRAVDIIDINEFLAEHRPPWSQVRWINVDGLADTQVLSAVAAKYELHPLAVEDLMRPGSRPKAEFFPGDATHLPRLFVFTRMISRNEDGTLDFEQIGFFLGRHTLITLQEARGDIWDLVRERIMRDGSALRRHDASYLMYALLDAIVDHCFPVVDAIGDEIEDLESAVLEHPTPAVIHRVHRLKHDILRLRRELRPMRELVAGLLRTDHDNISDTSRLFLRDVHDHCIQVQDMLETQRDSVAGLAEAYLNATSYRLTQVMKVLTIISTVFMPLSFLAGVYGMNFPRMPELHHPAAYPWSYPFGFWALVLAISATMLFFFKRQRWI